MRLASSALAYFIVDRAGAAVTGLHAPSGTPTRAAPVSRPEALVAAGRFEDAVVALTEAAEAYPDDPTPAFMLAELYRDNLREPERAATWFRKAAAVQGVSKETQREILRALVTLCRDKMGKPELAVPALSRVADLHAGDRLGHWARQELDAIRAQRRPNDLA